jgi:hypothetical protein
MPLTHFAKIFACAGPKLETSVARGGCSRTVLACMDLPAYFDSGARLPLVKQTFNDATGSIEREPAESGQATFISVHDRAGELATSSWTIPCP